MNKLFDKALKGKYAIGQFNISSNEQLKAVVQAAVASKAPVIVGASENERKFFGDCQLVAVVNAWIKQTNHPIILNADHCQSFESAKNATDAGFSAVHFDGSKLDLAENIKITSQVVEYIREKDKNITIEGELGYLRGGSDIHIEQTNIKVSDLTKPKEAQEFYHKTKIDNLAIVIGNIHGIEANMQNPNLNIKRLEGIRSVLPEGKFVLHGGSGTPVEDIKEAIRHGVVKININTELRVAFSNSLRQYLNENPQQVKPYNILTPVIKKTEKIVTKKIELFGSDNNI